MAADAVKRQPDVGRLSKRHFKVDLPLRVYNFDLMEAHYIPIRRLCGTRLVWSLGVSFFLLTSLLSAAPKDDWLPIIPAELAETRSTTNPDVPAEILYRRIESDLREAPFGMARHEYLRYKIYNPEKSDAYTRISQLDFSGLLPGGSATDFKVEIRAKLTLPDGTTKLFTKADIKERSLQKSASDNSLLSRMFGDDNSVTEKYLAVTGVTAGSILEYQLINEYAISIPDDILEKAIKYYPGGTTTCPLQNHYLPVRKVEFFGQFPLSKYLDVQYHTLNDKFGNITRNVDKKKDMFCITATDLPPINQEPLSGASGYNTLTVLECLINTDIVRTTRSYASPNVVWNPAREGAWSAVAAPAYAEWEDCSEVTRKVKKLAEEITNQAKTPEEKAQLIHRYAQNAYQEFRLKPRPQGRQKEGVRKMDDIITRDKNPQLSLGANDFLFLANALYKACGLECRGMLFHNRSRYPFNPQLAIRTLMSDWAVAVKLNGEWVYSMPQSGRRLPFGSLPWYCERTKGLVLKTGPQELIDSPPGKSADARILNSAELTLAPDGTLSGEAKRTYLGHHAYEIHSRAGNKKDKVLKRFFQHLIESDFKAVIQTATTDDSHVVEREGDDVAAADADSRPTRHKPSVIIKNVSGLSSDGPIVVEYSLLLPSYAQILPDRVLFAPSVFRSTDKHPFTASERHNPIRLPFAWQEIDKLTLTYPAEYVLEALDAPAFPSSVLLHYKNKLTDDPATHTLTFRREFASELITIPAEKYSIFKTWCDEAQRADQYQLVLTKKATP